MAVWWCGVSEWSQGQVDCRRGEVSLRMDLEEVQSCLMILHDAVVHNVQVGVPRGSWWSGRLDQETVVLGWCAYEGGSHRKGHLQRRAACGRVDDSRLESGLEFREGGGESGEEVICGRLSVPFPLPALLLVANRACNHNNSGHIQGN